MLFKPHGVSADFWENFLGKVEEMLSHEKVECDVCLIGSHARGDASPISDVDLVVFADGESALKRTEIFYIDETDLSSSLYHSIHSRKSMQIPAAKFLVRS